MKIETLCSFITQWRNKFFFLNIVYDLVFKLSHQQVFYRQIFFEFGYFYAVHLIGRQFDNNIWSFLFIITFLPIPILYLYFIILTSYFLFVWTNLYYEELFFVVCVFFFGGLKIYFIISKILNCLILLESIEMKVPFCFQNKV